MDIFYNIARLLFHVHNQYFQTEGVDLYALNNIDEVLNNEHSVVQPLDSIVKCHMDTTEMLELLGLQVSDDLLYNMGLLYTQVLEIQQENEEANINIIYTTGIKSQEIFRLLLISQMIRLQKFIDELNLIDRNVGEHSQGEIHSESGENSTTNVTGQEVLQPPDVFDTVLASYKLSQAMLENISNPQEQIPRFKDIINPFLQGCETAAQDLIASFGENTNTMAEYLSSISQAQINEYNIARVSIKGLMSNDLSEILDLWDNALPQLPEFPEKYLILVDNIQEFLDRNEISLTSCNSDSAAPEMVNVFWKCLTLMSNNLLKAKELLAQEKQRLQTEGLDNVGYTLALISNVFIKRSDIDLQKSQLTTHEPSRQHEAILFQNSKTFLKSAINVASSSGGLREKITEKLARNQKRVEGMLRLCALEGRNSPDELVRLLGRGTWKNQVPILLQLDYYEKFWNHYADVFPN